MPGSPAQGYGCQTFSLERLIADDPPRTPPDCPESYPIETLDVSGMITADTIWDAAMVRVIGNVTIANGVTLTIPPGVRVEFQDYYRLTVAGTLLAIGAPDCPIHFTTDEPELFTIDSSHAGCWNGIRFDNTLATNATSRLEYCIFEYSKATGGGSGQYPYGGGALSVVDYSGLTVANCIFRNNVADYGGAIFLYRNANPRLLGNLIADNHALGNASAIYCGYSYPLIAGNTIVRNTIHNENDPYIESGAILDFLAKPAFADNIIRDNDPVFLYLHAQVWNNKDYYTHFNNIADYPAGGDNLDVEPLFVDPLGPDGLPGTPDDDFRLFADSPCVDAGSNAFVPEDLATDLAGGARIVDGDGDGSAIIDMGAYEYTESPCFGDLDGDRDVDIADLATLLAHYATPSGAGYSDGDLDSDGDVDLADLAALLAVYGMQCD